LRTGVCGTDEHLLHGGFIATFPLIPGHEMIGEVDELGDGVAFPSLGESVAVDNTIFCGVCAPCRAGKPLFCESFVSLGCNASGGFAEYVVVGAAKCYPLNGLDLEIAVLAEPTACAVHGVDVLALKPASDVAIFGAGPTGLILSQLVRMAGAARVTVVAPTESKLALAKEYGAAHVIRADRGHPDATVGALRQIAPRGFDAVVEATGSIGVFEVALGQVARGGTLMVYGLAAEDATARVAPYQVFERELTIKGSFAQAHCLGRALLALRSGQISTRGLITDVVSLDEFGRALANLKDSSQVKTVVDPTLESTAR
jgi:D-arabinitol dehydrogenase (NADP+)